MRKTRQQEVAQYAWNCVIETRQNNQVDFEKYQQLLQGVSSMILDCGLGQTTAFYFSQSKPHFKKILEHWYVYLGFSSETEMIKGFMNDSASYRKYTNEVLALNDWLKRFSKGLE